MKRRPAGHRSEFHNNNTRESVQTMRYALAFLMCAGKIYTSVKLEIGRCHTFYIYGLDSDAPACSSPAQQVACNLING